MSVRLLASIPPLRRYFLGLDPERALGRLDHYDQVRGFARYAESCRAAHSDAAEVGDAAAARDLTELGVCRLDVMPATSAASFRDHVASLPVAPPRAEDVDFTDRFDVPTGSERALLQAILGPDIKTAIERHFRSPFLVYNMHVSRLRPGTAAKRSLLWHCDSGPSQHLKLLTYLDDSAATGGNTAFLDRDASDAFLRLGYTFGPLRSRRDDLTALAHKFGIRYCPHSWHLRAGQGILFEPSRVLHRGVIPTAAARHIVTLLLLPSRSPWHPDLEMPGRRLGLDFSFPNSASDLLAAVQH